jgi:trans-aconitate 2-methyltransferase
VANQEYKFGDSDEASARLRRLAEVYEPETRELLQLVPVRTPHLAVDLGCGPGWTTKLVYDVLGPVRTVGLDTSDRYIAEARRRHGSDLEFEQHDVLRAPFPVEAPDVLFCRFLLAHLRSIGPALSVWASVAAPDGLLFVHETETLESDHPTLRRYYELVGELQTHYGQQLYVGESLASSFRDSGWKVIESRRRVLAKSGHKMAELHLPNLRTWRQDAYASRAFDPREVDALEASLERITSGVEDAGVVVNGVRQIVAGRV